jgi:iron uptake system component EfeO
MFTLPRPLGLLATATMVAGGVFGCSNSDDTPAPGSMAAEQVVLRDVKTYVRSNLEELVRASADLRTAAPVADDDGWNATRDVAAVTTMKAAWRRGRAAYEHVEGAIAVLFPELDVSTDERYDGFLETGADDNLFDDQGVTGIHAIERILWSDTIRTEVVDFERALAGYKPAAFPATRAEAQDFKDKLAARLASEVTLMRDMFVPLMLDSGAAYRGVIGSIAEQIEKIDKAATGEEESRYSNETLADMRSNLAGGLATVDAFKPWLVSKAGGAELDSRIRAGFQRISAAYAALPGAALPTPPATWDPASPSASDLTTPFGKLYTLLKTESDEMTAESTVGQMDTAAMLMGIPVLAP